MVLSIFKLLFKRLLFILCAYTFCRILFFVFNNFYFKEASAGNIIYSFIHGVRFDISIILLLNAPFIIFSILPFRFTFHKRYQAFLKTLFIIVNLPPIFANIADAEYFKFKFKRTTADILGIKNDVLEQAFQLSTYYWYLILLFSFMVFIAIKFYPRAGKIDHGNHISYKLSLLLIPLSLGLTILGIRGGFQLKPLRPNHAFTQTPNILGNLVLNTPFSFIQTLETPGVEPINYYSTDENAKEVIKQKYYQNKGESLEGFEKKPNDNIVLIILESFSAEYLGIENKYPGYTPFLDSLSRQGMYYTNHFANGTTSIEALPAILASIPSLMSEPYITSIYQTNEVHGIAEILQGNGYHTSFFHGGKNGTMGFDVFAKNAGFKNYFGLNEYPDKDRDFDGTWGVFDEPFLQYFSTKLSSFPQPFISGIFTISSHQPYTIPARYKDKFPKGEIEILESIGYADFSLKTFFNTASKQPWFQNTLFIITADHTQERIRRNDLKGEFNVPLLLYHPAKPYKNIIRSRITQHVDIMPTILDYLNIENNKEILFGHSVLETDKSGHAITMSWANNRINLIKPEGYLQFDPTNNQSELIPYPDSAFKFKDERDKKLKMQEYTKELKAYLQYYNNGLIKNNWYKKTSYKAQ